MLIKLSFKKIIPLSLAFLSSQLLANSNATWTALSGATATQPAPAAMMKILGTPSANSIEIVDTANSVWSYSGSGSGWKQVTGGPSGGVWIGFGNQSPNSIVVLEQNSPFNLWVYNGSIWNKLTNQPGLTSPTGVRYVAGSNPLPNSLVLVDNSAQLWSYNGSWTPLTGSSGNQPSQAQGGYYGQPTPSSILIRDSDSQQNLWSYNGPIQGWTQLTGLSGQPFSTSQLIGNPTSSSIFLTDRSPNLWYYNGSIWTQMTGTGVSPQPQGVSQVFGTPSLSNIILNYNGNLWSYNSSATPNPWNMFSGSIVVNQVYGVPTTSSIVLLDKSSPQVLWTYNGSSWAQITGSGSPYSTYPSMSSVQIIGNSTPNFIVLTNQQVSTGNQLWLFNGSSWQLIGGYLASLSPAPAYIAQVYPATSSSAIFVRDFNSNLWVYNSTASPSLQWTQLTGGSGQPAIGEPLITPTSSLIIYHEFSGKLWIYQ